MQGMTIDSAAIRLTDTILGQDEARYAAPTMLTAIALSTCSRSVCPVVFAEKRGREPAERDLYVSGRVASALFQETIRPNRSGHCSGKRGGSTLRLG